MNNTRILTKEEEKVRIERESIIIDSELNVTKDFINICGYSRADAIEASYNINFF